MRMSSKVRTLEELRELLDTTEGKKEVFVFIEGLREKCDNFSGYAGTSAKADKETPIDGSAIMACFDRLKPFMEKSRPGHDLGHFYRDFLQALVLIGSDPTVAGALYRSDTIAGLLGGAFHDCAVAVKPRYSDNEWECGHAEVGAWLMHELLGDLVPEYQLTLVCYAVVAHTHLLKPVLVSSPVTAEVYERQPYHTDEIYSYTPEGYVGIGPWVARFADRLDTNGASHWARHVVAMADAAELPDARDFSGGSFFEINQEAIMRLLLPEIIGGGAEGAPTTFKHMQNFVTGNFNPDSPYSKHDAEFPVMQALITAKSGETRNMLAISAVRPSEDDVAGFDSQNGWNDIAGYIKMVSVVESTDEPLVVLAKAWESLTAEQQLRLWNVLQYAQSAYEQHLNLLACYLYASGNPLVQEVWPLIETLFEELAQ